MFVGEGIFLYWRTDSLDKAIPRKAIQHLSAYDRTLGHIKSGVLHHAPHEDAKNASPKEASYPFTQGKKAALDS